LPGGRLWNQDEKVVRERALRVTPLEKEKAGAELVRGRLKKLEVLEAEPNRIVSRADPEKNERYTTEEPQAPMRTCRKYKIKLKMRTVEKTHE
jgi:hypothetical protein